MSRIVKLARRFRSEEDGAAMVEYSVLIGLITALTIAIIAAVGVWVALQWSTLCGVLPGAVCP
jgi:pilus assembly protein Flp/PilA